MGISYIMGRGCGARKSSRLSQTIRYECSNCPFSKDLIRAMEEYFSPDTLPIFERTDEDLAKMEEDRDKARAKRIIETAKRGES